MCIRDSTNTHVTILKVDECIVSKIKTTEKDGYNAVQIASIETEKDISHVNKPQRKLFSSIKIKPKKILKEFRVDNDNILEVGTKLNADHFKVDQFIDASSFSIGKGFAGVMKRHNFGGLRASHERLLNLQNYVFSLHLQILYQLKNYLRQ